MKEVKARLATLLDELIADYASADHGIEIREIAGGYRMATKPEHHDVVRRLRQEPEAAPAAIAAGAGDAGRHRLQAAGHGARDQRNPRRRRPAFIATLLDRKLITTGGRKQVIGRPISTRRPRNSCCASA